MIPFADLVAALERYKRRKEMEAAAGQPAQAQAPSQPGQPAGAPPRPPKGTRS